MCLSGILDLPIRMNDFSSSESFWFLELCWAPTENVSCLEFGTSGKAQNFTKEKQVAFLEEDILKWNLNWLVVVIETTQSKMKREKAWSSVSQVSKRVLSDQVWPSTSTRTPPWVLNLSRIRWSVLKQDLANRPQEHTPSILRPTATEKERGFCREESIRSITMNWFDCPSPAISMGEEFDQRFEDLENWYRIDN